MFSFRTVQCIEAQTCQASSAVVGSSNIIHILIRYIDDTIIYNN